MSTLSVPTIAYYVVCMYVCVCLEVSRRQKLSSEPEQYICTLPKDPSL